MQAFCFLCLADLLRFRHALMHMFMHISTLCLKAVANEELQGTGQPVPDAKISDSFDFVQVLPNWAQKTLNAHKGDRRDLKSLEQLEKGTTGDKIWDALQHQLNVTGVPYI